jgi:phage shock protein A
MSYFSRLTDIVSCNLSRLLAEADDPQAAIAEIVQEMQEGLAGARRSVATASAAEQRLQREIDEHVAQVAAWADKARERLRGGSEDGARQCLLRKREVEDLLAGLEQQHRAAIATREHLATIQRALDARLAEALRRQAEMGVAAPPPAPDAHLSIPIHASDERSSQIDAELQALKQELGA